MWDAWGGTSGDYREMRLFADILDGLTNIIGKEYAKKTKINDQYSKHCYNFLTHISKLP